MAYSNCAINATLSNLSYKKLDRSSNEKHELKYAVAMMGGELKTFVTMNDKDTHTQAFMFKRKVDDLNFIAIRGTESGDDLALDGKIGTVRLYGTLMHSGFAKASWFVCEKTVRKLAQIYGGSVTAKKKAKIYITGHSLGGAAAQMLGIRLQRTGYQVKVVTTFGQPKIMKTRGKGAAAIKNGFRLLRYIYKYDVVSILPPKKLNYEHTGTERTLGRGNRGRVRTRVAKGNLAGRFLQHSLNNYLHYCERRSDENLRSSLKKMHADLRDPPRRRTRRRSVNTEKVCVLAGSQIAMADGSLTAIELVKVGDRIVSYDTVKGKKVLATVTQTLRHPNTEQIVMLNGETLGATDYHRVFTASGWVRADELVEGSSVLSLAGNGEISSLVLQGAAMRAASGVTTFNLAVDGPKNFFANGILVKSE
jgi:hypothetical protein